MDRTYIQSQHIVERYLSGDLTVREAREFEKYCQDNPDVLNSMPIPVRVKAKMARKPGEEIPADTGFDPTATATSIEAAGLEDDDDDEPASYRGMPGESRKWVVIMGVALAVALAGAGVLYFQNGSLQKKLQSAQRSVKSLQLRPPGSMQEYKVKPSPSKAGASTLAIGNPTPPQLVELRIDVSEGRYNMFMVTIDNATEGRAMIVRRIARDTNGELRIGINSSAMTAGDYELGIEGYTWRGETVPVGWVKLGLK